MYENYLDKDFISKYKYYSINMIDYLDFYSNYQKLLSFDIDALKNKINSLEKFLNLFEIKNDLHRLIYNFFLDRFYAMNFLYFLKLGYLSNKKLYHKIAYQYQLKLFEEPTYKDYQNALADFENAIIYFLTTKNDDKLKSKLNKFLNLFSNNGKSDFEFFINFDISLINKNKIPKLIEKYNKIVGIFKDIKQGNKYNFSTKKNILIYPIKNMFNRDLISSLAHESIHAIVYNNSKLAQNKDNLKLYLLQKNKSTNVIYQEGMACLAEIFVSKDFDNFKILEYSLRVIYTYELLNNNFSKYLIKRLYSIFDTFLILYYRQYLNKINIKADYFIKRIKRGFDNDTNYVFLKDWNYKKGYQKMLKIENKNNFLIGKVCKNDIEILKKLSFYDKNKYDFMALLQYLFKTLNFFIKNI